MSIPVVSPLTSGIASGTPNGSLFLRDDMTWQAVTASGAFWGAISNTTEIAVTTTATATINRMHVVSGTTTDYTITLPSASANSGSVIGFRVKDFSVASKQFVLDAGVGVKIAARTRFLTLLHTNVVLFISDGTDWQPLVLCLDTPWVDAGALAILGSSSNPTKGTVNVDKFVWRRSGRDMQAVYRYNQSAAGTAGSGFYFFNLPIGSVDASLVATWNSTDLYTAGFAKFAVGYAQLCSITNYLTGVPIMRSSNTVMILAYGSSGDAQWDSGSTHCALSNATVNVMANLTLQMSNW